MGIKERKAREQAQRRADILDAAHAIAVEEGWRNVSIRKIATRLEFSAAMLYEYFPAKQDVLATLAREGFGMLAEALAAAPSGEPVRHLEATVAALWDFAFENPRLFELMHSASVFEFGTSNTAPEASRSFALLREAIAAVAGPGRTDLNDLADILWGLATGMITLAMFGRVAGGIARGRRLLMRALADMVAGWESDLGAHR